MQSWNRLALVLTSATPTWLRIGWGARQRRQQLRDGWAKPERTRPADPVRQRRQHRIRAGFWGERFHALHQQISDTAADDLDLDKVFASLDRTLCGPGQLMLYEWLRSPVISAEGGSELVARRTLGDTVARDRDTRDTVRQALVRVGEVPDRALELLLGASLEVPQALPTYALLALAALAPLGFWVSSGWGLAGCALSAALTMAYHYLGSVGRAEEGPALDFYSRLLDASFRLRRVPECELEPLLQHLGEMKRAVTPRITGGDDSLAVLLAILTLAEERRLLRARKLLERHRAALLALFEWIGRLDAAQSLASVRAGNPAVVVPALVEGSAALEAIDLRHPLLADAVPCTVHLDSPLLITGSNMSGKSTFLRTVGVNVLLAQSLGLCFASAYRGGFVRLGTSLHRADDLSAGRSYYRVEADAVLELIRSAERSPRALILVDELFRGTGSAERVAAATAVLRHLERAGALVIAATHDRELTTLLAPHYRHGFFEGQIDDTGLVFDFCLKQGVASGHNGLALLRVLGYPAEVLAEAEALVGS